MERIDEEAGMDQPWHPRIEADGRQKDARSQHRPQLKADGECDPAEGFQPWPFVGNARRIVGNTRRTALTAEQKRSGPVALALKVAKRGRAQANTQKTSAFFGAVNLIRYHAGPDKLEQDTFLEWKLQHAMWVRHPTKKNWPCPIRCMLFDVKP
jgi:hypothetical protein